MNKIQVNGRATAGRAAALVAVVGLSTLGSYRLTQALRADAAANLAPRATANTRADTSPRSPFPSGPYLVAYVLLSSRCGFCTEKGTKKAISQIRDSLRASIGEAFARVAVIGVTIDDDLNAGIEYLQDLGPSNGVFDEVSVGGGWLNQFITSMVWRDGVASPEVPQVLLFRRQVDASGFPRHIDVQPDSLVLRIAGRDELIRWVSNGAPLDFKNSRWTRLSRTGKSGRQPEGASFGGMDPQ